MIKIPTLSQNPFKRALNNRVHINPKQTKSPPPNYEPPTKVSSAPHYEQPSKVPSSLYSQDQNQSNRNTKLAGNANLTNTYVRNGNTSTTERNEQILHSIVQLIMIFEKDKREVDIIELVKVAAERLLYKRLNHEQYDGCS